MAETTSEWSEVVVTSLGLRLDAKVKAGLTGFRVAKVTVGDGFLDEGDNPLSLTDLKHEIPSHQSGTEGDTTTADITIIRAIDTGTAAVKVRIQNGNESFYLREIGIWAVDPDLGLILYAYTNAGDNARMLEAYNGRTHIIRKLTIPFLLSNTTDITANCTFVAEVSEEMFEAYKTEVNTHFGTVIPMSEKGSAGGVAELDENGLVPSSQLPSYVDDILEYDGISAFPVTGESGKIYVDKATNKQYRWSGTQYTEVSKSLALGETESTAYRGDRGKTAYDHSQAAHAPSNAEPHRAPTSTEITDALGYTPAKNSHTHSISDITGLSQRLSDIEEAIFNSFSSVYAAYYFGNYPTISSLADYDASYNSYQQTGYNNSGVKKITDTSLMSRYSDNPVFFNSYDNSNDDQIEIVQQMLYSNGQMYERTKLLWWYQDGPKYNAVWGNWYESSNSFNPR